MSDQAHFNSLPFQRRPNSGRGFTYRCENSVDNRNHLTSSETASMKVNLIASSELFFELNWIRELLAETDVTTFISPKMELFLDNSIYVLSANHNPLRQVSAHFCTHLKNVSSKGLIHISDEFFVGPYELYQEFDFVIRQYHSRYFTCRGILTVPLGYTNELKETNKVRLARPRPYVWTFAGNLTAARKEMIKEFQSIRPNQCITYGNERSSQNPLSKADYRSLLANSLFCPCPMGNVVIETYRVYEALEMGCIPIVERRPLMNYYEELMPGHAIPTFRTWRDARSFVEKAIRDEEGVARLQQSVYGWWTNYKLLSRRRVVDFIAESRKDSFQGELKKWTMNKKSNYFRIWRKCELLKHMPLQVAFSRVRRSVIRSTS
jgi:hypothetical protein